MSDEHEWFCDCGSSCSCCCVCEDVVEPPAVETEGSGQEGT